MDTKGKLTNRNLTLQKNIRDYQIRIDKAREEIKENNKMIAAISDPLIETTLVERELAVTKRERDVKKREDDVAILEVPVTIE